MKTRAAVLREIGADWSVEEIELDEPKAGEILVKTTAAGMCHSDEHAHDGTMPVPLPIIGGHEGAGVVIGLGPGVTEFEVGDHISCSFTPSCGKCTWCARGQQNLCDLGAHLMEPGMIDGTFRHHTSDGTTLTPLLKLGTFAEHMVLSVDSAIKVQKDVPAGPAALVSCGVTTGYGSAVNRAEVTAGDTVVVVGCGGLGTAAIQGAKVAGAKNIVAIDPSEFKRESAMEFGATHTAPSMEEAMELVGGLTEGVQADSGAVPDPQGRHGGRHGGCPGCADGRSAQPLHVLDDESGAEGLPVRLYRPAQGDPAPVVDVPGRSAQAR